jgi:hypothetical protein
MKLGKPKGCNTWACSKDGLCGGQEDTQLSGIRFLGPDNPYSPTKRFHCAQCGSKVTRTRELQDLEAATCDLSQANWENGGLGKQSG